MVLFCCCIYKLIACYLDYHTTTEVSDGNSTETCFLTVSSVIEVFHSGISSFMLLIVTGLYVVLTNAMLLSSPGRWQRPTQQPIGIVSPVISIE